MLSKKHKKNHQNKCYSSSEKRIFGEKKKKRN